MHSDEELSSCRAPSLEHSIGAAFGPVGQSAERPVQAHVPLLHWQVGGGRPQRMFVLHPQTAPKPGLHIPRGTRPAQQINTILVAELATEGMCLHPLRLMVSEGTAAVVSGRKHHPSSSAAHRRGGPLPHSETAVPCRSQGTRPCHLIPGEHLQPAGLPWNTWAPKPASAARLGRPLQGS